MLTKRKKNTRQRGYTTHGWGNRKKHRGAGNRGGRGMAGTGKRGKTRKQQILGIKNYFGKHGFKTKRRTFITSTNIQYLEDKAQYLLNNNMAKEENGFFVIDLGDIGVDKLLSKGEPKRKYKITCFTASKGAVDAVKKAGGEVTFSNVESMDGKE
ncbi:MAG: uL15 family ribosomal protein [Candidatus Nanoarchaeia archaeon]